MAKVGARAGEGPRGGVGDVAAEAEVNRGKVGARAGEGQHGGV